MPSSFVGLRPNLSENRGSQHNVEPATRAENAAIVCLALVASLLCALRLSDGLFGDELYTAHVVLGATGLGDVVDRVQAGENTPPLFYLLARGTSRLGESTSTVRLVSLIAVAGLVGVCATLARQGFGRRAGLVAAALAAFSPLLLYYGTEARAYALATCLAGLATIALIRGLQGGRRGWWVVLTLASAGGLWSHYIVVFVLVAQTLCALVLYPEHRRPVALSAVATVVLFSPWIPSMGAKSTVAYIGALKPLTVVGLPKLYGTLLVGHPYLGTRSLLGAAGAAVLLALGVLALGHLIVRLRRGLRVFRDRRIVVLLVVGALATPLGLLIYGAFSYDLLIVRNALPSLPALIALTGGVLGLSLRRSIVSLVPVLVLVLVITAGLRSLSSSNRRPAYPEAAQAARAVLADGGGALEVPLFPFDKSLRRDVAVYLPNPRALTLTDDAAAVRRLLKRQPRQALIVEQGPREGEFGAPPDPVRQLARSYRLVRRTIKPGLVRLRLTYVERVKPG